MREILFRGKRLDNGEWVEGYLFDDGLINSQRAFVGQIVITEYNGPADDKWKTEHDFCEVDPETVGQYTGLTDKNGAKIFDGDILESTITIRGFIISHETYVVAFSCGAFGTEQYTHGKRQTHCIPFEDSEFGVDERRCEVIGNIHDNPELIGGADNA